MYVNDFKHEQKFVWMLFFLALLFLILDISGKILDIKYEIKTIIK